MEEKKDEIYKTSLRKFIWLVEEGNLNQYALYVNSEEGFNNFINNKNIFDYKEQNIWLGDLFGSEISNVENIEQYILGLKEQLSDYEFTTILKLISDNFYNRFLDLIFPYLVLEISERYSIEKLKMLKELWELSKNDSNVDNICDVIRINEINKLLKIVNKAEKNTQILSLSKKLKEEN